MAQLIKLQDFVSRYESDMFKYPSQFIRLKQQRWRHLKEAYQDQRLMEPLQLQDETSLKDWGIEDDGGLTWKNRMKRWFQRKKRDKNEPEQTEPFQGSIDEVKEFFLTELFKYQLKWASSTLLQKSYGVNTYKRDEQLAYWLRVLPDNYLILYRPVFEIHHTRVEVDTIILGPSELYCISTLSGRKGSLYETDGKTYWLQDGQADEHHINPLQELEQMEKIVHSIIPKEQRKLHVKKIAYTDSGFIDASTERPGLSYVDVRTHESWMKRLQANSSPIKYNQLNTARLLLDHCYTQSVKRTEWDTHEDELIR
ncbi:NERD domain-containing protein [Bacillaceae bacterium SIJ1]|uniref:nuclease-related domain-containing protein n=1 Tax=Litoribacterium kuwaitense TaxID=1398745 RepID=UPI0013EBDE52|nr:nuclease-related domain-containing protein [Litoribacterium kuwaitense]NGP44215.1 NERD domain-containing protein [Litoribacterium kuwaitense]